MYLYRMFTVIAFMFGGMAIGFLLRKKDLSWVGKVISALIWLLLLILGIEVGSNRAIIEGLGTLGVEALIMTVAFVAGSCTFAWLLWRLLNKKKGSKA